MPRFNSLEIHLGQIPLVALGVDYEPYVEGIGDEPPEPETVSWDMLYVSSDTGKNDITNLLTIAVQDRVEELLIAQLQG